ncbi:hypothetical protein ACL03H_07705 [Saccharopolyspora sp. MS10]|uniref:hypothetical protein n=1 Tax=Saccharopolyspora sp. MS10 TaxID=3385973 RepID=UPI00399F1F80
MSDERTAVRHAIAFVLGSGLVVGGWIGAVAEAERAPSPAPPAELGVQREMLPGPR